MAGALVVDASVAAKWYLVDEEDRALSIALLDDSAEGAIDLVAPDVIRAEVPSAIVAATLGRNPRLTRPEAHRAVADFLDVPIDTVATSELAAGAIELVHLHGCAFYDALYLALAQRLEIPFVTADRKLLRRIEHLEGVLPLSEYPAPSA